MHLVDTDVICEIRKGEKADEGVREFFEVASHEAVPLYLSVVTVGELRVRLGIPTIFEPSTIFPLARRLHRYVLTAASTRQDD